MNRPNYDQQIGTQLAKGMQVTDRWECHEQYIQ